jgi:hypothetical protein
VIRVTLTPAELQTCREVGGDRIALAKGNPRFAYKYGKSGLDTHRLGCMGELAAAKAIGIPWPKRVNTYRTLPDLDPFWEVRWTSNPMRVKVATDDPAHFLVCHVTGNPPAFEVHGYILAGWVQKNVPATDPGDKGWAAHFVAAHRLAPIDPGFHSTCQWGRHNPAKPEEWVCVICGNRDPSSSGITFTASSVGGS